MSSKKNGRSARNYGDGSDLEALKPIDVSEISDFDSMAQAMELTSFGGRRVGEAVSVLHQMVTDNNCFRVLTLAGAMTPAQMGLVICDIIEMGFHAVISTGALLSHGFVQGLKKTHFKVPLDIDDCSLYHRGYNRIYDTVELEKNLDDAEQVLNTIIERSHGLKWNSARITREIGLFLERRYPASRSIFQSAVRMGAPIFVPAFTDSELGLDFAIYRYRQILEGKKPIEFHPFDDLDRYTRMVSDAVTGEMKLGIFTIGGGVPRNWGQQVGPHLDIRRVRVGKDHGCLARFHYGVRICTATEHDGGLSGCSYREGVSWGKFVPHEEGGRQAEIVADATMVLPFIIKAVQERIQKK